MFLALQGDIWVTTIHFTNCIVIRIYNISNYKPSEIRLRQASLHHPFIQTCPKQALGLFCFHLTQRLIHDNKKDHTHAPQAIFKIKDHKKDVTCKKFMDPSNFQVPLKFPKTSFVPILKFFLKMTTKSSEWYRPITYLKRT
jgi:hypothetical protein